MRSFSLNFVLALIGTFAAAQDFPKAEIFGGYSYGNIQVLSGNSSANGWNASVTVNFYKWFGLTSDFSGVYGAKGSETTTIPLLPPITETIQEKANANVHTFMFGPQFSLRRGRLQPLVHFLIGEARSGESVTITETGLPGLFVLNSHNSLVTSSASFAAGGGFDYTIKKNLAWRVQADYMSLGTSNDMRVSTGIVFRLGR